MYGLAALFFLIVGGIEALLIRSQLWSHNMEVLTNRQYNQMFTMHGTTMYGMTVYATAMSGLTKCNAMCTQGLRTERP